MSVKIAIFYLLVAGVAKLIALAAGDGPADAPVHLALNSVHLLPGQAAAKQMFILLGIVLIFRRDLRLLCNYLGEAVDVGRSVLETGLFFIMALLGTTLLRLLFIFLPPQLCEPNLPGAGHFWRDVIEPLMGGGGISLGVVLGTIGPCLLAPAAEELLSRGVLFMLLLRLSGRWSAVIGSSVIFSYLHQTALDELNIHQFISSFLIGVILCWLLLRTNRLRWCILLHVTWNSGCLILSFIGYLLRP
ncbi:MAG: CPBP family intramembrane metalloprotease [Candidatus Coatesbacteria bacterium]|nr:CPBP family intramembrane metalloprotease [Candidatus Coatesbacteria bacterium]